jgi:hypothetical protein
MGWKVVIYNFWILSNLLAFLNVSLGKLLRRSRKSYCGTPKFNSAPSTNALASSSAVYCLNGIANRNLSNSSSVVNIYRSPFWLTFRGLMTSARFSVTPVGVVVVVTGIFVLGC